MRLRAAATHPLLTPYPPGDLNPASLLAAFQPHTRRITTHLIVCVTTVGLVMRKNSTNNSAASKQQGRQRLHSCLQSCHRQSGRQQDNFFSALGGRRSYAPFFSFCKKNCCDCDTHTNPFSDNGCVQITVGASSGLVWSSSTVLCSSLNDCRLAATREEADFAKRRGKVKCLQIKDLAGFPASFSLFSEVCLLTSRLGPQRILPGAVLRVRTRMLQLQDGKMEPQ